MFGIDHYGSFIAAILIFQAIPGAGTIAILNATGRYGLRAGFIAVAGTLLGDLLYMIGAVIGLATVMQAHPQAFEILRWGGAAYLVWMAVQLLRARSDEGEARTSAPLQRTYFLRALLVGLTNPKVILFFVAFFPLFIRSDASAITLIAMMLHVTAISFLYQAGLVVLGNALATRLRSVSNIRKIAMRVAGTALLAFGVRLALDDH